jgi:hypothetical protein
LRWRRRRNEHDHNDDELDDEHEYDIVGVERHGSRTGATGHRTCVRD